MMPYVTRPQQMEVILIFMYIQIGLYIDLEFKEPRRQVVFFHIFQPDAYHITKQLEVSSIPITNYISNAVYCIMSVPYFSAISIIYGENKWTTVRIVSILVWRKQKRGGLTYHRSGQNIYHLFVAMLYITVVQYEKGERQTQKSAGGKTD